MAERTIDILLRLDADKKSSVQQLSKELEKMTAEAKRLEAALNDAIGRGATEEAKKLEQELKFTNGYLKAIDDEARKLSLEKSLAASAQRAGQLKQKLESLGRIGNTLAVGSAAILTPLVMAVNKYKDSLGETEPTSKRLVDLSKRWEESQIRLGRVVAEQILPHLEKALDYVDKAVKFAEDNPGFIDAAVTIVGAIGILGTILSGIAQVGQALVAFQTLTAGLGLGGAATGTVAAGGAAAGIGGLSAASIGTAVAGALTSILTTVVPLAIGAEIGRQLTNYLLGTDTKWEEILTTFKQVLVLSAWGWDNLFGWLGLNTNIAGALNDLLFSNTQETKATTDAIYYSSEAGITAMSAQTAAVISNQSTGFQSMGGMLGDSSRAINQVSTQNAKSTQSTITDEMRKNALEQNLALYNATQDSTGRITSNQDKNSNSTIHAISGLVNIVNAPGKASGGDVVGPRLFWGGEKGREFMLNSQTTKAAENIIGGKLTQARLLQALAGGRNVSYHDARRFDASVSANDRRMIRNDTMLMLSEALG